MKKVVNVGVLSVVTFFAIMLCGNLTSCSKGDDGDGSMSSKLVGTWVHSNVRLVFKADRTGSDILDLSFVNGGVQVSNFKLCVFSIFIFPFLADVSAIYSICKKRKNDKKIATLQTGAPHIRCHFISVLLPLFKMEDE